MGHRSLLTTILFLSVLLACEHRKPEVSTATLTKAADEKAILVHVPTLPEVLRELDKKACAMKFQYSIEDQSWNGEPIFVGFAWPQGMSWRDTQRFAEDGGVAVYIGSREMGTQLQAAIYLLALIDRRPNYEPSHKEIGEVVTQVAHQPPVTGPKHCGKNDDDCQALKPK